MRCDTMCINEQRSVCSVLSVVHVHVRDTTHHATHTSSLAHTHTYRTDTHTRPFAQTHCTDAHTRDLLHIPRSAHATHTPRKPCTHIHGQTHPRSDRLADRQTPSTVGVPAYKSGLPPLLNSRATTRDLTYIGSFQALSVSIHFV